MNSVQLFRQMQITCCWESATPYVSTPNGNYCSINSKPEAKTGLHWKLEVDKDGCAETHTNVQRKCALWDACEIYVAAPISRDPTVSRKMEFLFL